MDKKTATILCIHKKKKKIYFKDTVTVKDICKELSIVLHEYGTIHVKQDKTIKKIDDDYVLMNNDCIIIEGKWL